MLTILELFGLLVADLDYDEWKNTDGFICFLFPRWKSFKRQMLNMRTHSDAKGFELKRPNDSIYMFPCPDCMCWVNNKSEDSRLSSLT